MSRHRHSVIPCSHRGPGRMRRGPCLPGRSRYIFLSSPSLHIYPRRPTIQPVDMTTTDLITSNRRSELATEEFTHRHFPRPHLQAGVIEPLIVHVIREGHRKATSF
ncbi:hypothetical protein BC826DRAFT_694725 [Russula brevipes]|nr:hypothetical protein BC826DRAFT_694725 [Russula brevipes]